MSDQNQGLPGVQDAYNHLFERVHSRVFFGKLASAGRAPRNAAQAQEQLKLAHQLRVAKEQQAVKAAEAADDPFAEANDRLSAMLGSYGVDTGVKAAAVQEMEVANYHAAARLAEDPDIYNSVLSLKAAEAEVIRQQQAQYAGQG